jgi:hypothetical protein
MGQEIGAVVAHTLSLAVVCWILSQVRRQPAQSREGRLVLRYAKAFEQFGWICSIFLLGVGVTAALTAPPDIRTIGMSTFGAMGLMSLYIVWVARVHSLSYTSHLIYYKPLVGPEISFPWGAIAKVKYSGWSSEWIFQLNDGRKFRVSRYMDGHRDFLNTTTRMAGIAIPRPKFH